MKRAIVLAAGVALLAALAPAGAAAFTPPKVTMMKLAVEITGIHVVDWHYQSTETLDPEEPWQVGSGTQTLGFSTPKPVIYGARLISGNVPGGNPEPFALTGRSFGKMKSSLRRRATWRYNDGNPCGGEGCPQVPPSTHPKPSCPAKRADLSATLELVGPKRDRLNLGFTALKVKNPWTNCPPDVDGARDRLSLAQPGAITLPAGIARLSKLRRGGKLTLKGSAEIGSDDRSESRKCPPMSGQGMRQCAVTEVTVEVTRLR